MKKYTEIYRNNIIDSVYPSDLNSDNIKDGLRQKEEMLNAITDEYVESILPDADEIYENIKNSGISDEDLEKFANGEISANEVSLPQQAIIKLQMYATHTPVTGEETIPLNTWTDLTSTFEFDDPVNWTVKFRILISGDNFEHYELISEGTMVSGWYSCASEVDALVFEDKGTQTISGTSCKVYESNVISFASNTSGAYGANEWIRCTYQQMFIDVVSITLACTGT